MAIARLELSGINPAQRNRSGLPTRNFDRDWDVPFKFERWADHLGDWLYLLLKKVWLPGAPIERLPVKTLWVIQTGVNRESVRFLKGKRGQKISEEPILVARINGKNFVFDGTHRATEHWLTREPTILAHFMEFKGVDEDFFKATENRFKDAKKYKMLLAAYVGNAAILPKPRFIPKWESV